MRARAMTTLMITLLLGVFMMLISLSATAVARGGRITIKGSDTMVILNQRWAEEYMRTHRGIIVQVTGGGSGTGIAALLNGTTDICAASRPLKAREIKMLKRRFKRPPVKFAVAMDGIAIYVNRANPIKVLTLEQIRLIYTGRLNNWRYVGGPNRKIVRYGRENNSGTYAFLKEHVLRGADYANDCQAMPGTAAVVNAVAKDKWAIGYGGIGYAKGVKIVAVKKNAKSPAYLPTETNVVKRRYPITRYLYFYTAKPPTGIIKQFINWVLSPAGQKIVKRVGYFPVRPIK